MGDSAALVVGIDRRAGMARAAAHLIALGHRKLGFFGGTTGHYTHHVKLHGLYDAANQAGVTIDAADIWPTSTAKPFSEIVASANALLRAGHISTRCCVKMTGRARPSCVPHCALAAGFPMIFP